MTQPKKPDEFAPKFKVAFAVALVLGFLGLLGNWLIGSLSRSGVVPSSLLAPIRIERLPSLAFAQWQWGHVTYRKSNIFLAAHDQVDTRYELMIQNDGDIAARDVAVNIWADHAILEAMAVGEVLLRSQSGVYEPIGQRPVRFSPLRFISFKIPCLNPSTAASIQLVVRRIPAQSTQWLDVSITHPDGVAFEGSVARSGWIAKPAGS